MAKLQKSINNARKRFLSPFQEYWTKRNYIILLFGIAILVLGYILMAQSPWDGFTSLTLSPIVLLIGYVIVIPLAIMLKSSFFKK
ncbi:MAG: hypothetical protein FD143_1895 [Ignavibacteria bacterium]|nr:MAG: hypothetical protein FD143_1895 [Ignavibacteria bacterium]KAF0159877.1 MAG: hypothetical protein FD188_2112 [Ignavibacteria bacterium]